MKIVLSTSPHIKHSTVLEADFEPRGDMMYAFAPLGLLMLAASLRDALRITPKIFDMNAKINEILEHRQPDFYRELATALLASQPDIIGFMSECDSYHHVLQICQEVKRINPRVCVVLGGPHASAVAEPTLEKWDCIDKVVLGEGEITFVELVRNAMLGNSAAVPGTYYRNEDGKPVKAADRPLVEVLDELPFPAYDLYAPVPGEELFVEVGRGCPFNCTFCSTAPFWQRKSRLKSASRIVEELVMLKGLFDVKRVHFTHDLFTTNKKWVESVCYALIDARLDIKWTCSSRVDTVSDTLLGLMAAAGCDAIFFGVESGSERVLERIGKPISRAATLEVVALCTKHNIKPNAGLIVGFPFEDEESISDSFDMYIQLLKAGTKPVHMFSYCPFVQSSLYQTSAALECTGNFVDIPLEQNLEETNRRLVKSDPALFGSYFKPKLNAVSGLAPEVLTAIDEFALLVDCTSIPALIVAETIGGMKMLFLEWVRYIRDVNSRLGRKDYRLYFGSPVDFCSFLNQLFAKHSTVEYAFLPALIELQKKNFLISSRLRLAQPLSMATYKSKTVPANLSALNLEQQVSSTSLVDCLEVDYDVTGLLALGVLPADYRVEQKKMNLVWQYTDNQTIALLEVSDFVINVLKKTRSASCSLNELIIDWAMQEGQKSKDPDYEAVFYDIQAARANNLIKLDQL